MACSPQQRVTSEVATVCDTPARASLCAASDWHAILHVVVHYHGGIQHSCTATKRLAYKNSVLRNYQKYPELLGQVATHKQIVGVAPSATIHHNPK